MKSFVLILSFLLFVSAITCISTNWRSDDEVIALYEEWLVKHQKLYSSLGEKIKRFEIFKDNLRYIDQQNHYNKVNHMNFTLGLNQFADLTLDEFSSIYLGTSVDYEQIISSNPNHDDVEEDILKEDVVELPDSVDWREKGVVFPIRNQGKCGSCWTFSAVASIETLNGIKKGHMIALSEQELLDCETISQGCKGGHYNNAFAYVAKNGITSEEKYPYIFRQGQCYQKEKVVKISGYKRVPRNNGGQLQSAVAQQVVSVAVKCESKDFQFYDRGIFSGACGPILDHAVNIVGYGSKGGANYWIMRNSWGTNWGENGYMRIQKNSKHYEGHCGIAMQPSYPV
uniref:Pro-asclepain f n=1 Tax=Gomphocarpus fruticosus subsp. fruticosus TaxID=528307 RepID=B5BLP0_9GENT|nr:pro-asclepain f [Gomphocarpus fruticosus subsp. fruticosus]